VKVTDSAKTYFRSLKSVIDSIAAADGEGGPIDLDRGIEQACHMVLALEKTRRKLMFIGNGASAAISSHMAADFLKNGEIETMAFNDGPLLTCIGNDYGYKHVFEKPIERVAHEGDLLIAISSSGNSENILLGVSAARSKRCEVITLSGFEEHNPLSSLGDLNFYVPSQKYGPVEVVHHAICHCILDMIVHLKNSGIVQSP
jgi:D-sedoheptulose 7-phosphate isomerase